MGCRYLFSSTGFVAYIVPLIALYCAWIVLRRREEEVPFDWLSIFITLIGLLLVVMSLSGLFALNTPIDGQALRFGNGGILGGMLSEQFWLHFGLLGGRLLLLALFLLGLTIFTDISWMRLIESIGRFVVIDIPQYYALFAAKVMQWLRVYQQKRQEKAQQEAEIPTVVAEEKVEPVLLDKPTFAINQQKIEPVFVDEDDVIDFADEWQAPEEKSTLFNLLSRAKEQTIEEVKPVTVEPLLETAPVVAAVKVSAIKPVAVTAAKEGAAESDESTLPELSLLLKAPTKEKMGYSQETLDHLSRLLEEKLLDFRIEARVTEVLPGPVVTRFEIEPAAGVKVSSITNLAKDIARSLAVVSVRVVEVIAGKTTIGIEIPNEDRQIVYFSDVVGSELFEESASPLTLALGHDIAGEPVIADLAKMPHLLVAGTTGSGKSVGVNAMLLSMLFKSTPKDVRLILVDPKMLELSIYDGIPHLLTPVITDMKDAANGLRWCVGEMERRYKLLAKLGVRNLAGFNRKILEAREAGEEVLDPLWEPEEHYEAGYAVAPAPALDTLPYIVVVIDEFADMMMVVGKKVEELIARIAQKARAAGIHLILATQRPSVDVITGLIKANIPTRMAFQVSSKIDSRTILDQGGAEQLLGHGDMLYMPPGTSVLTRVHGAFVDDDDVHQVVASWKEKGEPDYIESLLDEGSSQDIPGIPGESSDADAENDPLYDEAVAFVIETRKASISSVQRKLRVGYNRAARLIESMEEAGLVSGMGNNGQREVLVPGGQSY